MGAFLLLLVVGVVFGEVVKWEGRSVQVRVPPYSVLTVEVPCGILNVAHLDSVKSAFPQKHRVNSVHLAVSEHPTSVGITCEEEGVVRSYNLFLLPDKQGGTTYLKIEDEEFEKKVNLARAKIEGRKGDSSVLEEAKELLRAMLLGRTLAGYEVKRGGRTYRTGSFEVQEVGVWSGRLIGVLYKVKNVSPMREQISPSLFAGKGTVLVWLEDEERKFARPKEERMLAVVYVGKVVEGGSGERREEVLPYEEK